jgi:CDGSH-type Zn-finger protein/truncated hemoglobin YjbI
MLEHRHQQSHVNLLLPSDSPGASLARRTIATSITAMKKAQTMANPSTTVEQRLAKIVVSENGPYQISGVIAIRDAEGNVLRTDGNHCLCRCGGSRNKPFCDATHGLKGFVGAETAGHSLIADRRASYRAADSITVYDDRSRCAHFGQCTDRLPAVFRAAAEPFVDANAAPFDIIADVVSGCPSGALAYARGDNPDVVEIHQAPSITPIVDGPYRVRGAVEIIGANGVAYEMRERQTLCRCGQSRNKPFCDGSHWYAGFRDPLPPELVKKLPTVYEWAGGMPALERLTTLFYDKIFADKDPILEPVFRGMNADHPKHVAAWLAETFGGPQEYTAQHGGYEHMLAKHRNLGLTEVQRQRWVSRMAATADEAKLPDDPDFRSTFVAYLEWGTRIALINSQVDAAVIEHAPVPHWGWGQTPPFEPQQWDAPDAAERGRERYALEQAKNNKA